MDFFINEILENQEIKDIILNEKSEATEAEAIAEEIKKTGKCPSLDAGILPIFVLGFLADFALQKNDKRGIDRQVTVNTLKDINIWLDNYQTQYNKLGLAEFNWLFYHYTGDLFRLGRLQFRIENSVEGIPSGQKVIETHIPQGEPLNTKDCLDSFNMAKTFFSKHFSEFSPQYFMCDSWLLNPNLEKVLNADSNIVQFMRLWHPFPFPEDNSAQAIERVFGFGFNRKDIHNAPETTSLQKRLKNFLLCGGNLNVTAGYRKI